MSECKTILTFNSGRTVSLRGDWLAELEKMPMVHEWQLFPSGDWTPVRGAINMNLVETVQVVDDERGDVTLTR